MNIKNCLLFVLNIPSLENRNIAHSKKDYYGLKLASSEKSIKYILETGRVINPIPNVDFWDII